MSIKTCEGAARAGVILVMFVLSMGAFASGDVGDYYSFEGLSGGTVLADASLPGLSGNGTVTNFTYSYGGSSTIGYPLPDASHANVLDIAGTVVYTNAADVTTGSSQVDFMFKVEPTDELEDPAGDDVQIALAVGETNAVGNTAPIKLWCTANGANGWISLKDAEVGAWVRASFVLNYDTHQCKVSIDGYPVVVPGAVVSNAWYSFANAGSQRWVKSITMVGSTMIDDFVVTNAALSSYAAPGGNATVEVGDSSGVTITYDEISRYGLTAEQVAANAVVNETSGLSIADKLTAGLDPTSDTKFELKTMTVTADKVRVTFPGLKGNGNYKVKVATSKGGASVKEVGSTQTSSSGEGENSAEVDLTELTEGQRDGLLYFTVETGSVE